MIDTEGVYEDLGYRRDMDQQEHNENQAPVRYKLNADNLEIWRLERIKGELAGEFVWMREDFAKDLIKRGYARRIS